MKSHSEGLVKFYSSQAELLLAQYENINQLLGQTKDWTHPGTHCEILLRDFLRRHLLKGMSVDKGYVYGRVERDGKEYHGPEIDILIHDINDYRPVFRLEDFVIIQPEAVLGMIQVKRTFRRVSDNDTLANGIRQAVDAKQHLLDVIVQQKTRKHPTTKSYAGWSELKPVFSAVVSFEDETDRNPETYRKVLLDAYTENSRYVHPESDCDTAVYVLPHFVGSLRHLSLCSGTNVNERSYGVFESEHQGANIGLQILLYNLTIAIFERQNELPPFAFPDTLTAMDSLQVPRPSERLHQKPKKANS
ncbi:MAG: hypothetical protein NTY19_06730 [Planctomycetota bacterium]|nr:hypothetical protein [Planctomycetota bacterium]